MSRADDIKAKAARIKTQNTTPTPTTTPASPDLSTSGDTDFSTSVGTEVRTSVPTEVPDVPQSARTKPVRLTVDITRADHAHLNHLARETATTLGTTRVAGQEIMRALLRRYLTDPHLQHTITTDITTHRNTR